MCWTRAIGGIGLAVALALMPFAVAAQAPRVDAIEIVDAGIYAVTQTDETAPEPNTAAGHVRMVANHKLLAPTDQICGRLNVSFGFKFTVVGQPAGASVMIDWVTRFPDGGVVNPKGVRFLKNELSRPTRIGETTYRIFTFDEAWEIALGQWVLELHHNGRKLAEQRFNVTSCMPLS